MSEVPEEQQETRAVPVVWVGIEDQPVYAANQYIGQVVAEDEIVLTLGHAVPPALLGDEEQRRAQLAQIDYVPVRVIARVGFTPRHLGDLLRVLQETLDVYTKMYGESSGRTDNPSS